jgi:hypothetical protein
VRAGTIGAAFSVLLKQDFEREDHGTLDLHGGSAFPRRTKSITGRDRNGQGVSVACPAPKGRACQTLALQIDESLLLKL